MAMALHNLTMVKLNGEIKVAQRGQWSGRPTEEGALVAEFVQAYLLNDTLRAEFAERVAKVKAATEQELVEVKANVVKAEASIIEKAKEGFCRCSRCSSSIGTAATPAPISSR